VLTSSLCVETNNVFVFGSRSRSETAVVALNRRRPLRAPQTRPECLSAMFLTALRWVSNLTKNAFGGRIGVVKMNLLFQSFTSRAALNGHIRIHGVRRSPPPASSPPATNASNSATAALPTGAATATTSPSSAAEEFPCKTCGK